MLMLRYAGLGDSNIRKLRFRKNITHHILMVLCRGN